MTTPHYIIMGAGYGIVIIYVLFGLPSWAFIGGTERSGK